MTLDTSKVKKVNQNNVFTYIYKNKIVNKAMICDNLNMCLSTVNSNLKNLEQLGVIKKNGFFESTGGRKSDQIEINVIHKCSIGIAILKNKVHIVATNLYCETLYKEIINVNYSDSDEYYMQLSNLLNDFITKNNIDNNIILGVSVATQGLVIDQKVTYSKVMGNSNMSASKLKEFIKYDLHLEHDSKCAADLSLWKHNFVNGCVLLLNNNLGSAIIVDKKIIGGLSGTIEHYHLDNDNLCYCGNRGCFETICSVSSLEARSGLSITNFFSELRNNNSNMAIIWKEYLDTLSTVINNINYVIDGTLVLSGQLSSFLIPSDIKYIFDNVSKLSPFRINDDFIITSDSGEFTQAIGAALYFIKEFISTI
ncbi:MAG: ROK family protein [bacterium]